MIVPHLMLIEIGKSKVRVTNTGSFPFPFVVEMKIPGTQWGKMNSFAVRADAFRDAIDRATYL